MADFLPFAEIALHAPLKVSTDGRRMEAMECMSEVDLIEPQLETTYPMYLANRNKVLDAGTWAADSLIIMTGDKLEMRTGSDTEILFRQASNVWYLANVDRYDVTLVLNPSDGKTMVLVKRQTQSEDNFNGLLPSFEELAAMHDVDDAMYADEFMDYAAAFTGTIYTVDDAELQYQFPDLENTVDTSTLAAALRTARAVKTEYELTMLRHSSQVATDAHIKAWEATSLVPPFNNEFVVANAFESASYSCGLRFQAYIPIVASGPNSATLHYNANDRTFVDGDLMLIDAAPETKGYTSDVSRTYPVNGKFSADQKLVYDIVLNAQNAAIEVFVPGNTWAYVSSKSTEYITQGLLDAGFIQGEMDELLAARVSGTFMPHGLGHSVGLDVHDVPFQGEAAEGHVYTIEPGVYFVDHILDAAIEGPNSQYYNVEMIDRFRGFGGVRIEDVIAVTATGNECLSCSTPRETAEIEAVFASFDNADPVDPVDPFGSTDDSLSTGTVIGIAAASALLGAVVLGSFYRIRRTKNSTDNDLSTKLVDPQV